MTTRVLQKLHKSLKELKVLKVLVSRAIGPDTEGEYKKPFEKELKKLSKEKTVFKYSGKGSLLKELR